MKARVLFPIYVLLMFTACDNILDAEVEENLSGDIYTTQENIEQALNGAYFSLGGIYDGTDGGELFGGDFIMIPMLFVAQNGSEVAFDNVNGSLYTDFIDNQVINTNVRIEANWRRAYEVINLLNNILKNIDVVTEDKDRIHGEALGMRGMLYFEMVRLWGPEYTSTTINSPTIPLLLKPINSIEEIVTPELATVQAVYNQVSTDLSTASGLLEPYGANGIGISYFACETYLMRLAMHMGEYAQAETRANNILEGSGPYQLVGVPMAAFNNFENCSEDIFAIQQTTSNTTGDITTGTGLTYHYSCLEGRGFGTVRILPPSLFSKDTTLSNGPQFSSSDLRSQLDGDSHEDYTPDSVSTSFYRHLTSTSTYSCSKFLSGDRVIPVIRLAEIYLARAEAIYQQTNTIDADAIADLNMIRTRAGIPALGDTSFVSPQALFDSIKLEKKREFLYEGLIFHDLKRWGDSIGNPATIATDPKFILPIPQAEIDTWK